MNADDGSSREVADLMMYEDAIFEAFQRGDGLDDCFNWRLDVNREDATAIVECLTAVANGAAPGYAAELLQLRDYVLAAVGAVVPGAAQ